MERRRGPGGAEEVETAVAGGPPISAVTAKGGEAVRAGLGSRSAAGVGKFGAVAEGSGGVGSVVDEEEGGKKKGEWKCGGCGGRSVSFVYGLVLGKFGVCSDGLKRPK